VSGIRLYVGLVACLTLSQLGLGCVDHLAVTGVSFVARKYKGIFMTILSNTSRQESTLAFVRILVRNLSANPERLSPELREYVFQVAHDAAKFAQHHGSVTEFKPEAIELAFQIADKPDLVQELSGMESAQAFNKNIAQRLMDGFQRFAPA